MTKEERYETALRMLPYFIKKQEEERGGNLVAGDLRIAVCNAVEVAYLLENELEKGGTK